MRIKISGLKIKAWMAIDTEKLRFIYELEEKVCSQFGVSGIELHLDGYLLPSMERITLLLKDDETIE